MEGQMGEQQARNQVIDGFRGVAILSVMAFHYLVRWQYPYSVSSQIDLSNNYPTWISIGKCGVDLFFVISGLVITMTILRSRNVGDFATRRFARLYPGFVAAATLIYVLL